MLCCAASARFLAPAPAPPPQNIDPSAQVNGALLDEYGNSSQVDYDDVDEDELIGVSINNTSYIPRSLLKKLGFKIVKDEETGEWEAVEREGADQVRPDWARQGRGRIGRGRMGRVRAAGEQQGEVQPGMTWCGHLGCGRAEVGIMCVQRLRAS